jgi:deoxyuridine 5'-triphosphate nucleotidohydrolase
MDGSMRVQRLDPEALLPTRGSSSAAGLDLYALEEVVVPGKGRALVRTGLSLEIPEGLYGRIAPRSGLSFTTGLVVNAGVIDSDYRGEVKILFHNYFENEVKLGKGSKVAQLILERIALLEVEEVLELGETQRGAGGFGSTGV